MRMEEPFSYPSREQIRTGQSTTIVDFFAKVTAQIAPAHPFYSAFHSPYEVSWEYSRRLLINELAGGLLEWREMNAMEQGEWDAVVTLRNMQRLLDQYMEHEAREREQAAKARERKGKR